MKEKVYKEKRSLKRGIDAIHFRFVSSWKKNKKKGRKTKKELTRFVLNKEGKLY